MTDEGPFLDSQSDLSSDMAGSSSEDDVGAHDSDDADMRLDPTVESPTVSTLIHLRTDFRRAHSLTIVFSSEHVVTDERRRSPSVPWSASPPPDSDHDDFDLDFDSDVDWDSSSLSVPSPAPALRVKVETTDDLQPFKRELADIRDMLDAWEDFDLRTDIHRVISYRQATDDGRPQI